MDFSLSPPRGEKPKEDKRSLFRELGLPYVADPAISRHLAAFLESSADAPPTPFSSTEDFSSPRSFGSVLPISWKAGTAHALKYLRTVTSTLRSQVVLLIIPGSVLLARAFWFGAVYLALTTSG